MVWGPLEGHLPDQTKTLHTYAFEDADYETGIFNCISHFYYEMGREASFFS